MTLDRRPEARLTRRRLLITSSAALVAGAAAAEAGNLLSSAGHHPAGAGEARAIPPDVDLMAEHGVLQRLLLVYQAALPRLARGDTTVAADVADAATIVHDFIESFHEALEEGYVFPRLRAAGQLVQTVDTLLLQHARGRLITQFVLGSVTPKGLSERATRERLTAALASFCRMYQPHEAREDTVVFPAFRRLETPAQLDELADVFATLQDKQFGPNGFAATVGHVAAIEQRLDIYDLSRFTPAAVAP